MSLSIYSFPAPHHLSAFFLLVRYVGPRASRPQSAQQETTWGDLRADTRHESWPAMLVNESANARAAWCTPAARIFSTNSSPLP
jgi:hypothetical protein